VRNLVQPFMASLGKNYWQLPLSTSWSGGVNIGTVCFQRGLTEAQNGQVLIWSLAYTPPNFQAPNFTFYVHRCKFLEPANLGACAYFAVACRPFLPQILHTRSPTAPIWNFLMVLHIIATEMKENGWVFGALWGFEPFSMEITTLEFTCTMSA